MYRSLILASVLLTGTSAMAQAPAAPPATPGVDQSNRAEIVKTLNENFDKSDVNNDGFLSEQEVRQTAGRVGQQLQARMEQQFKALDKDQNGQLSLQEFQAAAAAQVAQLPTSALQQLDANKDGKVSAAEFNAPALTAFDRIDTNTDGTLSADEKQKAQGR